MDEDTLDTSGAVSRYLAGRKPDAQVRSSMAVGVAAQPDQEAEFRRLALRAGVPLDTAKSIPDEVKRSAALNSVDFNDLAARFPSTTKYLSDVNNAQIAHDDVNGMSLTEGLMRSLKRGVPSLKQNLSALSIGARQSSVTRLERELSERAAGRGREDPGIAGISDDDLRARIAGMRGADVREIGTIARTQGEKAALPSDPVVQRVMDAKGFGEAISAFSTDPVKFVANIGPESLIQSVPGIGAAVLAGPAAGAAAMGGGSFAVDYGSTLLEALQKEGVDLNNPEALLAASKDQALMRRAAAQAFAHAGVVGALDAVSGGLAGKVLLPGKVAAKLGARPLAREIANMAVQTPVQGVLGGIGELGGEIAAGQDISPGNILAEIVGEAFTAPAEAAGVARTAIRERMQQARAAKQNAEVMTQLAAASEASKVKGRDPQSFKNFIDSAAENGPVQDVYLAPQALAQSGVDVRALSEASPSVAEQIDAANASGTDIRIPVSEFATNIAGTDLAQSLIPHLRTDPEGMSLTEADQFMKEHGEEIRSAVESELARRDTTDAARAGRDTVRDSFLQQILATGRYNEDIAKPNAALAASFYATMAGRLGTTADQLYAQYPLRITATGTQEPSLRQDGPVAGNAFADERDNQASPLEPLMDSSVLDSHELANVFEGASFSPEGDGLLSAPSFLAVLAHVGRVALKNHQVLDAVIGAVPVDVVNRLFGTKAAAKAALNDQAVLQARAAINADLPVSLSVDATNPVLLLLSEEARMAAEGRLGPLLTGRRSVVDGSAPGASEGGFGQTDSPDGRRAQFIPSALRIELLEKADLTSTLHELGHAFLEISADIAARPGAPADIAADLKTLLDWFGIQAADGKTQLETWRDMSLDEQRESHEKFARGFEAYLFGGKAPSLELQGVFQRFRAWLMNVYQSLKSLNVSLSDEVRGVMDRMLASEQEIETAEAAQAMAALFQTPEQAQAFGLDWAKYQELGRAQTEQAISEIETRSLKDMQWLSNARSRTLKALQKDAAEKRRAVRSEVRTEVMAEPIYRAWAFLTGKVAKPIEPTEAEVEYRKELKDFRQRRVEAQEQAAKSERAKMLAENPELKGLQKGQFLAKNKRQIDINAQQRMLEWDQANREPEAPPSAQGDVPEGFEVGKLNLESVKTIDKDAAAELQKRRMTSKDGIDPDVLAEQFGFQSGQQFIRALVLADTPNEAVEGLTDQRMLERYGDITSPEALARAVNDALFNDARQRAVATELKALEKAMKVRSEGKNSDVARSSFATLPAAAKKFAEAMVARLLVKDIKPNQYAASQARAARAAAQALGKDGIATAAKEKRNELVNGYAYRAAVDALNEVREARAFFKQVLKSNRDTISKTRDVNIVMAMRAILGDYGIGVHLGDRASEYLERVKAYDPAVHEVLKDRVEGMTLAAQPYQQISLERLRGLTDELRSMWEQSRSMRQVEIDGKKVDREQVEANLLERMEKNGIPDRIPGEGQSVTPAEDFKMMLLNSQVSIMRVESWVTRMDRGETGPFRTYIWQPIKEAADRYRSVKGEALKKYRDLLKTVDLGKSRIDAPELGYVFGASRGGSGKQEILHALLHTGNQSNKRKLLLGRNWAFENEDGTLNTTNWDRFVKRMEDTGVIGKEEYDFAQGVWDLLESLKPAAQKAHKAVFGHYFDEVTADGFTNRFGTYRGGYVPAVTDPRVDAKSATRALMEAENQSMAYAFPTTSKGFTKSRVEYNRPLMLDLRTLSRHIDKVTLFSNLEAPIRDVRKVLGSDNVSEALNRINPAAINEMLNPWLQRAATQQVETYKGNETFARFSAGARKRAGMAAMFGNIANAAQQLAGFFPASVKTGPKAMVQAMGQYITSPKKTAAAVAEASPYMATRMDNEIQQMNSTMSEILLNPNVFQSGKMWLEKHAYFMQSAVDNIVGPIVWTAAYNEAVQRGESHTEAVRRGDSLIRTTQGSTLAEDISRFEGGGAVSGHPFVRLFSQFAGWANSQANFLGVELANTFSELGLRKGAGRAAYILMVGFLAQAVVAEAIVQAFKGGPEDDDHDGELWDDWLAALGIGTFKMGTSMVPGAGNLATALYNFGNDKPYDDRISTSPAISMLESTVRAPFSVYQAIVNDGSSKKAIRDLATFISMTVGVPANAAARPIAYLADVNEGVVRPTGPVDAARGLATGTASPDSKK